MKIPPRSSPCLVLVVVVGSLKETIIIVRCCFVIVLGDFIRGKWKEESVESWACEMAEKEKEKSAAMTAVRSILTYCQVYAAVLC
jgi:hypothetical protein